MDIGFKVRFKVRILEARSPFLEGLGDFLGPDGAISKSMNHFKYKICPFRLFLIETKLAKFRIYIPFWF